MTDRLSVLVVDDEAPVGDVLCALLKQAGNEAHFVTSAAEALTAVDDGSFDCVIADYKMPGMNGNELLAELKRRDPALPVIMLSAFDTESYIVEAKQLGAADWLFKPIKADVVKQAVKRATQLAARAQASPPELPRSGGIVGSSAVMAKRLKRIDQIAKAQGSALVRGESGTGKELVARAIHKQSARRDGPFIPVNCAAVAQTLVESEFFGHEKGAFTGAHARRLGLIALAEGGTLFLDEIGDLPLPIQSTLLRFLAEKKYRPLGAASMLPADVRIVAATHQDLDAMAKDGRFREDLLFRVNTLTVELPPLRDRGDDIRELALTFLAELGPTNGKPHLRFADDALDALMQYTYPGNVRELSHLVERLVVFTDGATIKASDVREELPAQTSVGPSGAGSGGGGLAERLERKLDATRREFLVEALERTGGNVTQAARLLGLARRTGNYWIRKFDIDVSRFRGVGRNGGGVGE